MVRSKIASQDLSVDPMSAEFGFSEHEGSFRLVTVYIHASVNITEDISIYYDSADHANYDTLIEHQTLLSQNEFVFAAAGDIAFNKDDKIRVEVTNANTTGTVYVTVKTELIHG